MAIKYFEFHAAPSGDPFIVRPDGWVRMIKDKNGSVIITFEDGGSVEVSEDYKEIKSALLSLEVRGQ